VYLAKGYFAGGFINLPAVGIAVLVTSLLILGTRESATVNAVLVCIKVTALVLFIALSIPVVKMENFHPFMPLGALGVGGAAASIFFAYVGFDAVSTAAEETKNPQRNMPIGLIGSLLICTVFYLLVAAGAVGSVGAQPVFDCGGSGDRPRHIRTFHRVQRPRESGPLGLQRGTSGARAAAARLGQGSPSHRSRRVPGAAVRHPDDDLRPDARVLQHGARQAAAGRIDEDSHTIQNAARRDHDHRRGGDIGRRVFPVGRLADLSNGGTLAAFFSVALGGDDPASDQSGSQAVLQDTVRLGGGAGRSHRLPGAVCAAAVGGHFGVFRLGRVRTRGVRAVRLSAQRAGAYQRAP